MKKKKNKTSKQEKKILVTIVLLLILFSSWIFTTLLSGCKVDSLIIDIQDTKKKIRDLTDENEKLKREIQSLKNASRVREVAINANLEYNKENVFVVEKID